MDHGARDDQEARDAGDDHARELAEKLRLLAAVDPDLAREWVAELVGTLDRTTGGTFGGYLSPAARRALGLPEPAPSGAAEGGGLDTGAGVPAEITDGVAGAAAEGNGPVDPRR